jgi:hypothetical protein
MMNESLIFCVIFFCLLLIFFIRLSFYEHNIQACQKTSHIFMCALALVVIITRTPTTNNLQNENTQALLRGFKQLHLIIHYPLK